MNKDVGSDSSYSSSDNDDHNDNYSYDNANAAISPRQFDDSEMEEEENVFVSDQNFDLVNTKYINIDFPIDPNSGKTVFNHTLSKQALSQFGNDPKHINEHNKDETIERLLPLKIKVLNYNNPTPYKIALDITDIPGSYVSGTTGAKHFAILTPTNNQHTHINQVLYDSSAGHLTKSMLESGVKYNLNTIGSEFKEHNENTYLVKGNGAIMYELRNSNLVDEHNIKLPRKTSEDTWHTIDKKIIDGIVEKISRPIRDLKTINLKKTTFSIQRADGNHPTSISNINSSIAGLDKEDEIEYKKSLVNQTSTLSIGLEMKYILM